MRGLLGSKGINVYFPCVRLYNACMSNDKTKFDEERTKAIIEIGQRHIDNLQQLLKSHQGIDLQIEVMAEFARFRRNIRSFE